MTAKGAPEVQSPPVITNLSYWRAYMALRRSRNNGFDIGDIPISEIIAYAEHAGICDPVGRERLIRIIGHLSEVEVNHGNSQFKA